ncbi:type IV pilus twitching motility protein PilT [bacterium]|nr:type IV pilus twitching motility protein PilT [bacterium]
MEINLKELLQNIVDRNSSDLHLTVGLPPMMRIDRALQPVPGFASLTNADVESLVYPILNDIQTNQLKTERELDFSFSHGEKARFRGNAFHQKGFLSAAYRMIPYTVPTLDQLNLPSKVAEFCKLPRGFVLVTGATSQGKSTTLASMIDHINTYQAKHIITIEDPIEYVFKNNKSIIQQRELFQDTMSWARALKSVLREDPDVVLVGEMRDYETISNTVTIAETGHLVFATLHTNSAAQSVNRLIDVFPDIQQAQVRTQLADCLQAILSQRLVPAAGGGMVPAVEVLIANSAVRNTIREGKTHMLDNIINTNLDSGMISLERSLADLVNTGKVTLDTALGQTLKPDELKRLVRNTTR